MATTNLSMWRDRHWVTISQQLLYAYPIDASNFQDGLLKKDTQNGEWLFNWLGRAYNEYSTTARETAVIRIMPPNNDMTNPTHSLILDITVRRHSATIVDSFPVPFGIIAPPAATSVTSTSADPTAAETSTAGSATAGPSSTAPNVDDVPEPSSSSSGKKAS